MLRIHEVDVGAVVVEELDALRLGVDARELLPCAERPVDDGARFEALQLRADEGAALAGLDVLELDDPPDLVVQLDVHPVLEAVRVNRLGHDAGGYPCGYSLAQVFSSRSKARDLRLTPLILSFLRTALTFVSRPESPLGAGCAGADPGSCRQRQQAAAQNATAGEQQRHQDEYREPPHALEQDRLRRSCQDAKG